MQKILFSICLLAVSACVKEENPAAISQLLFECYDPETFGQLRAAEHTGLPETCSNPIWLEDFSTNNNGWWEDSDSEHDFDVSGGAI